MGGSPSVEAARLSAFREALEKLGFVNGQTILIEVRYAMGQPDRLGGLTGELVALAPAVIVCVGSQETISLQAATRTIPIVFLQLGDPVEQGFVASLSRPGGNTTGFTQMEIDSKRLELLHELAPSISRAAYLINPTLVRMLQERFAKKKAEAKGLRIDLRRVDATTSAELSTALAAIEASSDEALLAANDRVLSILPSRIVSRQPFRPGRMSRAAACLATAPTSSKTRGSRPAMSPR